MTDVTGTGRAGTATGPDSVRLEFAAGEPATAPLTWAQRVMWGPIQWFGKEASQFNLTGTLVLAAPADQARVLAALRTLVERHQALRSHYVDASDGPRQRVAAEGCLGITVAGDRSDPARVLDELTARLSEAAFDHEVEWPLRLGWTVDRAGRVTGIALAGSHLALDGWAFTTLVDLLREQFADEPGELHPGAGAGAAESADDRWPNPVALPDRSRSGPGHVGEGAGAAPTGAPAGPTAAGFQPVEQAVLQSSPEGERQGRLALRHWEDALSASPASMFDLPRAETGDHPIERHLLDSVAAAEAASWLAARTRTSFSSVLLGLTAMILTAYNGHHTCVLKLIAGNRLDRRSRELIAINAQDAFLAFPVPETDLLDTVRQVHRPAFDAYRRAQYDPVALDALLAETGRRRGVGFDLSAYFNNGHRGNDWPPASPDLPAVRLDRLRRESRYTRLDPLSKHDMKFMVAASNPGGGVCRLGLLVDTAYLPGVLGEVIVRGIETLLCDAVTGEVRSADIAARVGMTPARRGPDWVRTPDGWVRPDDVAELVREAAGGATTGVFAPVRVDPRGTRELTAYVAAGWISPEELHRRVLDALPGRPGLVAPAEYVICEPVRRIGAGFDAWRDATVVATGSGRPG
ncbi:hypothetical protein [Plantactinospora sp. KLBMP9567]|uniref:hypothetical protein n=1 Tax=Plantactinospora sp. KLBMP9567 TaxID=3085900 RepID=UPI002980D601|nr:hypothetical protein [Plantactinospora sp. KLBMP9567]MDW5325685.1 hypothetical protein [Plantactinospora sp. KLBMP9567]